ncbi:MAG: mandelate racemase/muconate lactonizing enzyme family protein [Pirellulales bacterium]|nr:mandelate racemase/muconate lactonizing enzyme family protein [Pirellulales bacterium]
MPKSTEIRPREFRTSTQHIQYRAPMKFGGRVVTEITLLNVEAIVETRDGRRGVGQGSMPMSPAWSWPGGQFDPEKTLAAMLQFGRLAADAAGQYADHAHPLAIAHDLTRDYDALAQQAAKTAGLDAPMPKLAQLNAASPIDAAIHDAYGQTLGGNSYNLLGPEFVDRDLSAYLSDEFAGEFLDRYTLRSPKPAMPLYHLIGALDPLTDADLPTRLNDGAPETLGEWIAGDELTHLKIKLNGDHLEWDVDRVVGIEKVAVQSQAKRGCPQWWYSLDFNERCANVDYVLEFLRQLEVRSPAAFRRVQYIEQPTHRDLRAHPENRMHAAAKIKPVVIDESLIDFSSLLLAREMGYSGVALKACKGHSEALLMGAAAQKFGMFLCVQDLTCPGASFLHSVTLAARIPTIAAIEGNARQYCPAGNRGWAERFPGVFHPRDGVVESGLLDGPGLGF